MAQGIVFHSHFNVANLNVFDPSSFCACMNIPVPPQKVTHRGSWCWKGSGLILLWEVCEFEVIVLAL